MIDASGAGASLTSASAIVDAVAAGVQSPGRAIEQSFARARQVRAGADGLNAILWSDESAALHEAATVEERGAGQRAGGLAGVPVVIKDNIATLDTPTTCGSHILEHYRSPFEATVVRRLRDAGAVVVAKTNLDEFAMGSSTEYSAFGRTKHPLDPALVPGGSSGGSAAAVAAGIAPIGLGSETGGSVRQPAAFCGVVGVKPTYGRVSRFGLVAFASSLDQVGVFGATVDDAALALQTIAGRDSLDATTIDHAVGDYRKPVSSLRGLVIGRPREYFPEQLDPQIAEHCDRVLEHCRSLGATVKDVSLPNTNLAIPVYYIVAPAEASSNLARFDGVRYGLRLTGDGLRGMYEATRSSGFGPEVTRRILLGTYVLSAGYYDAYYAKAMQVRSLIARDFAAVFGSGVDVLFTPTTPTPAFPAGSKSDPYEMYLSDIFTVTANLAGIPAMSLPIGRVGGLPVGGQLLAPHFAEGTMFRVAQALERALGGDAHR
ncbi:MAG TPA: Asp-tRNA(Asn)/Glu-tRNA(Gln) amidotransferase subunit GatA [Gemmatimonadaceae bacterium]|nr:Asp-tRNA(Asn)/Glu-tRNA(Gln) amidotransferase subunit GatA [Gemmatimonadaceae bacterium]